MKILIVADWQGTVYAEAFYKTFKLLGHEVKRFSWKEYFKHYQYSDRYETDGNKLKSFYYKFQNKFIVGPVVHKINSDLLKTANTYQPDFIFIYRGTHIFPETIECLKREGSCLVYGYNNDDPFSSKASKSLWRYYLASVPFYDHIFSYRWKNIKDYENLGYKKNSLLRSYFIEKNNFYIKDIIKNDYMHDVIFIGHFEDDNRDMTIKYLLDNNIDIKLYGPGWEQSKYYSFFVEKMGKISPLYEEYNLALNSAKIALVFLSKLNHDTYTRRCFEIPATKTMMMSEYTDDLNSMFEMGKEAEYFKNKEELLQKIEFYLANEKKIIEIGNAGYVRLHSDGHTVLNRVEKIIAQYNIDHKEKDYE